MVSATAAAAAAAASISAAYVSVRASLLATTFYWRVAPTGVADGGHSAAVGDDNALGFAAARAPAAAAAAVNAAAATPARGGGWEVADDSENKVPGGWRNAAAKTDALLPALHGKAPPQSWRPRQPT